jgi:hypothetical protein
MLSGFVYVEVCFEEKSDGFDHSVDPEVSKIDVEGFEAFFEEKSLMIQQRYSLYLRT